MIELIDAQAQEAVIKVIGVGGCGGNAVDHMIVQGVQGVEFICANTDAQALARSSAAKTIQLGSSGLGAGSKPDKGREAAEAAVDDIRAAINGAHMLFITAGMGGGTGTGAAPVIAKAARDMGIERRRAGGDRLGEIVMRVEPLATKRDETAPGRQGPRIGRDPAQWTSIRGALSQRRRYPLHGPEAHADPRRRSSTISRSSKGDLVVP